MNRKNTLDEQKHCVLLLSLSAFVLKEKLVYMLSASRGQASLQKAHKL